MPRYHKPRRGSRAFIRKRAEGFRVRHRGLRLGEPTPLGFVGYKAGMTHAVVVPVDEKGERREDKKIMPVTVVETPPLAIVALRAYTNTPYGKQVLREARKLPGEDVVERSAGGFRYEFDGEKVEKKEAKPNEERLKILSSRPVKERASMINKDLERRIRLPKKEDKPLRIDEEIFISRLKRLYELAHRVEEIRFIVATLPRLIGLKKVPDLFEIGLGISPEATAEDIREIISLRAARVGSFMLPEEALKPGEFVDAIGITKGHGFTGVIKRFGVKRLSHKSRKKIRGVGSLGPRHPNALYRTVPMPGQYGYFRRVDYNKLVLYIGRDGEIFVEGEPGQPSAIKSITPAGGYKHYGVVKDFYVILKGSVPGPYKRAVILRKAIRMRTKPKEEQYKILDFPLLPVKRGVSV